MHSILNLRYTPSSGSGFGHLGKKGDPENHNCAIRLAVAHVNAFKDEQTDASPKGTFRYTPDLTRTMTNLGTIEDPKIRHVWGTTFHYIIVIGLFAALLISKYNRGLYPMVTGTSIYKQIIQIVHGVQPADSPFIGVGLDYSGFDATVQPWMIKEAFDITASNLHFDEEMHQYAFDYSRFHFITRSVVMPDACMWLKRSGIPSGSYFTQLVGSIVNHFSITIFNY